MRRSGPRRAQHAAILHEAVSLATVEGLEGLSIGTRRPALNMSKSGLYAHFGSKQSSSWRQSRRQVGSSKQRSSAPRSPPRAGVARLVAVCDAFFEHLERRRFPGGCFFAGAGWRWARVPGRSTSGSSGPELVRGGDPQVRRRGEELGQLADDEDPDQLTFELNGIILAANTNFVLHDGSGRARYWRRRIVRRRLGLESRRLSAPIVLEARARRMTTLEEALAAWGAYEPRLNRSDVVRRAPRARRRPRGDARGRS